MTSEDDTAPEALEDARGHGLWKPPSPAQLQGLLQGFEIIELIGCGGMGAVFRARQISLDRMVAIKLLPHPQWDSNDDNAKRFRQEAQMMARITHPGIISVYDFGETRDGQLFFVMEYVRGVDVAQMIIQQGKLQALHALSIAAHVCDTLRYAHEHGIIHRDIKPSNVMVDMEGRVKVADFGLASLAAQDASQDDSTTLGTPDYVAPEALVIGHTVDHRADLYSLGVMLYEMLTGKVPGNPVVPPCSVVPGLDKRFDTVIKRALEADPNARYQNAAIFRKDLDQILSVPVATLVQTNSVPVRHMHPNRAPAPRARSKMSSSRMPAKSDTPWTLIIVIFIAMVAGAYFYVQSQAGTKQKTVTSQEETGSNSSGSKPEHIRTDPAGSNNKGGNNHATEFPKSPFDVRGSDDGGNASDRDIRNPRLKNLSKKLSEALEEKVTRPHKESSYALDKKFAAALDREYEKTKDTASKDELLKLSIERSRARSHTLEPPADYEKYVSGELKKLREIYWAERAKLDASRNSATGEVYEKHERALSTLHDGLINDGRIEQAAEVEAKLKEIKQMRSLIGGVVP